MFVEGREETWRLFWCCIFGWVLMVLGWLCAQGKRGLLWVLGRIWKRNCCIILSNSALGFIVCSCLKGTKLSVDDEISGYMFQAW